MKLVIVESPTKAKTISKFLPRDYKVESSFGHVRDLPEKTMGIDIENNFTPKYVVPTKAKKQVDKLKALNKNADEIILATDEDREGEAIAWHLEQILKPKKYERITFHEITKKAIDESFKHPREISMPLVDAQQARRVLDRLVGYELSPFLWRKVAKGLSAGRVQSVAVRLVVEREREIQAFKSEEYWSINGLFSKLNDEQTFEAKLQKVDGKNLDKMEVKNQEQADLILNNLQNANYHIAEVEKKELKKNPLPPFTTSTLQQAANNRLHFSAKQTMRLAQQLYEGVNIAGESVGLITYMRTDSLNMSNDFLAGANQYIKDNFGADYAPEKFKYYKTKSKGAQEAHEAIRPTDVMNAPDSIKQYLDEYQYKLYNLIWQRALASQMNPAIIDSTSADINDEKNKYTFRATGQTIRFDGYLKVYPTQTKENLLPELSNDEKVTAKEIKPEQHFTEPPARYTEATLIKALEEYGIGRPSTYAPTIATIQERNYVTLDEKKLKPTDIAFIVNDLLVKHFPQIIDFEFTADMEKDLDSIAEGEKDWQPVIKAFYDPFKSNLISYI